MQKIGDIPNTRADNNGEFTDGNVAGGVPPTILPAEWFNTIQRELISILTAAGIDPDSAKFDQVSTAVSKLITAGGFLKTTNNLSEIKTAGAAAIAATLANLGLSDVAHLPQLTGVVGNSRNAKMSVPAASATATFTADELIVQTGLGGRQYKLSSFSKTINLATTSAGAGGMDTGTVPAAGFVALYAIYNPTTQVSALLAVNATSVLAPEVYGGANMPSGYTASALVSVWRTASSQFTVGFLRDRKIVFSDVMITTVSSQVSSRTAVGISAGAPINATSVKCRLSIAGTGTSPTLSIEASTSTAISGESLQSTGISGLVNAFNVEVLTPQVVYWICTSSGTFTSGSLSVMGYSF